MVEFTVPLLLDVIRTAGILVGIVYYVATIRANQRNQRMQLETRQTQIFLYFYDKWTETENWRNQAEILEEWSWKDPDDFMQKYGPEHNPEAWNKLCMVAVPFENLGVLVYQGLVDPKIIWYQAGYWPIMFWEKIESAIYLYREQYEPEPKGLFLEWTEELAIVMRDERDKDREDLESRIARRWKHRET
jgi:hypothetical protein